MLALLTCCFMTATAETTKPNIVFILSDDQAWTDYGFMGHPKIRTPRLDKLAKDSLVFPRGYVASPICRPSLASMVTGLFPHQHGITGNDVAGMGRRGKKREAVDKPMRDAFHAHPSFIKMLTDNGYLAHQSGKWWEGSWQDGGFTAGMTHGKPEGGGRHGDVGLQIGRSSMTPITDFVDEAVEQKKPFLLWYAPYLPHAPHNPPRRLLANYIKSGRSLDAKYYACCEWLDETCGQLIDHLEKHQLMENTLIIYACDNGWTTASSNADDPNQKNWSSFGLRSKGSPYENGIRTPIMLSWRGKIKPGTDSNFAHAIDLFPTIAAAAKLDAPSNLPGIDLLDKDARESRKAVFGVTHSSHNIDLKQPDSTLQYLWCIDGDWKLLVRYKGLDSSRWRNLHTWDTNQVRLYNVKDDPHERNELSADNPEVVARLKAAIAAWHKPEGVTQ
jgi:arylsulfatase A-like enzyme